MKINDMIPETEVKLVLSSKQVLEKKVLSSDFSSLFNIGEADEPMDVWYIDTLSQKFRKQGWSLRYRFKPESGLELTYKKRYTEPGYKSMLQTNTAQGFSKDFKPEIDLGYSKMTCSLSCTRLFEQYDEKLGMLEARRLAILNCPPTLLDWNSKNKGFGHLCEAVLLGPVKAQRYKGEFDGQQIKIEIWPLGGYFSELSFDIQSEKSAEMKAHVVDVLEKHNYLKKVNTLKTDAMLDYYAKRRKKQ